MSDPIIDITYKYFVDIENAQLERSCIIFMETPFSIRYNYAKKKIVFCRISRSIKWLTYQHYNLNEGGVEISIDEFLNSDQISVEVKKIILFNLGDFT